MSSARLAVLQQPEVFVVEQHPKRAPGPGEVEVRVHACGVCGSDLKMWSGRHAFLRPPLVMGHELVGVIERAGAGVSADVGRAVVVFPPVGCGSCFHCANDQPQLCAAMEFFGGQRPGGLADFVVVPAENVVPITDGVPERQQVLVEPLSVAVHALNRGGLRADDAAVVIGAGAIGLFTALVARARGAGPIVVSEVSAERRARAQRLGFAVVDPAARPLEEAIADAIRPEGADVTFECVGSSATINAALAATRKGGRAVVVGNAPVRVDLDGLALQRGDRDLVGVLMYDRSDFIEAMALLADGLLAGLADDQLTRRFSLEHVADAFLATSRGDLDVMRAIVEP